MNQKVESLKQKLKDERSKKVVFVSHCLLNENTRYLGGAFRKGCVDEVVDELQHRGIGIVQMKCPEQKAWGGVLKTTMWNSLGSRSSIIYKLKWFFLPLFIWNTKRIYRNLAKEVAEEINDYKKSGFEVVGVISVDGSPSCGVNTSLSIKDSFEYLANTSVECINRKEMNEFYFKKSLIKGSGLFVEALRSELKKRDIEVKFYEHSLVSESQGE